MSLYLLFLSLVFNSSADAATGLITQGSLNEALAQNWRATFSVKGSASSFADCDSRNHDKALTLAKALDDHFDGLKKMPFSKLQSGSPNYFQVGPAIFREEKASPLSSNGWVTQSFGWDEAYMRFQEIQNSPVDEKWAFLNRDVRAILREDQKRLVSNLNLEISHTAGPVMMKTLAATETCLQTLGCYAPAFDQESVDFTRSNSIYRSFLKLVERATENQHKVDLLQKFRNRAKADYEYFFGFSTGNALKRVSATEFELSLDSGSLRGYEGPLETLIKSVWSSDKYRLSIKWVDANQTPNAYKISFQAGGGGNPEADRSRKIIYLFQGNQFRSLAHEIGHAMGFSDHYFDVWNSQNCRYVTEINSGDIMSEVKTGKATASEWLTLDANYPVTTVASSAVSMSGRYVELVK